MRRPLRLFFSFDARLHEELRSIARHHQSARLHRRGVHVWGAFGALVIALLLVRWGAEGFAMWLGPLILLGLCAATLAAVWQAFRNELDLIATARAIEQEHPELKEALRTAAEQTPAAGGRLTFLQRRLLKHALDHAAVSAWHQTPRSTARQFAVAHFATLAVALGIAGLALRYGAPWRTTWEQVFAHVRQPASDEVEVTPGNQEVERGSTVVVAVRFPGSMPADATLLWRNAAGASGRIAMSRSLADPVFASTLNEITSDTVYSIDYGDGTTADFALTIYELPALVRADASLDYPDYTGLTDRTITDTRRIGAVEGTRLDYQFIVNRPVATAELRDDAGTAIPLEARNPERTLFGFAETLTASARYKLHLATPDGRVDPVPADIRIEVVPNERPELALNFPRGDQRVSPIQEIHLNAQITDDFGLLDYGIATAIGSAEPEFHSFRSAAAKPAREAEVNHLLALEQADVDIDELITWFAWAEDYGPDGQARRTTGDLFFAEVRPLDEIFREDSGGGGAGGGQNGPAGDLIEIQRQLSIAIWNLLEEGQATDPQFREDVETLRDSQAAARTQLTELRAQLDDPQMRGSADLADQSMNLALDELTDAAATPSVDPLDAAFKGSQAAFRALLRLQPKETRIVQSNNGSSGGGRNRQQIDQLRMRRDANDYATQSEAESEVSPEDREQLNLLSRLRELSRRQQDLNERLQELQTALAAATTEEERDRIRRELKRLEEEQRRMLADLDDARQRLDRMQPGEQREQARQQLDETRENMQQAGERLAQGEVSSALAAGSRAQERLENTSDEMREDSTSVFADQLRELREQARQLSEEQQQLAERFDRRGEGPPSLDASASDGAGELLEATETQRQRHAELLNNLRQVTEDSEGTEPTLHRQLYDLMREQGTQGPTRDLEASAELLRRGFLDEARRQQAGVQQDFDRLRQGIERAADSVLGNEATEMRFATNELEDLARQLQQERQADAGTEPGQQRAPGTEPGEQTASGSQPGEQPGAERAPGSQPGEEGEARGGRADVGGTAVAEAGQPGEGGPLDRSDGSAPSTANRAPGTASAPGEGDSPADDAQAEALAQAIDQLLGGAGGGGDDRRRRPGAGPLTGRDYAEWSDRLRTVESLLEDDGLRQRLAEARAAAEDQRREWQRHGAAPQWELVQTAILDPLLDVQGWLKQELARREDPTTLQPIDRDPVPDKFAESVRRYYESLGANE